VWEFWPLVFYVNKSHLDRQLMVKNFCCLLWRLRLIFAILYFYADWVCVKQKIFTHAECPLKMFYACWAWTKKFVTHAEHVLKNVYTCCKSAKNFISKFIMHTECAQKMYYACWACDENFLYTCWAYAVKMPTHAEHALTK
jgi:hypothetical protein